MNTSTTGYTTVDRIIGKLYRDLKDDGISATDVIEWTGEAMNLIGVKELLEHSVAFMKVKNYECEIPAAFQLLLQIARYRGDAPCIKRDESKMICLCDCRDEDATDIVEFPIKHTVWSSTNFMENKFTPVRLSNHSFFGTYVYRDDKAQFIYDDEYTIVGLPCRNFRFSFKEGLVVISYYRNALDPNTGYPLIPDDDLLINAIAYYTQWKLMERNLWTGKDKITVNFVQEYERKWRTYAAQAASRFKMPKSLDQYQNMMEETHNLLPRNREFYSYFGNYGRREHPWQNNTQYI